jgi:hypothetical protein
MNVWSRKHLFLSVLAIVGLLMMLGQMNALAQPSDVTPRVTIGQQVFSGGSYQVIDTASPPCSGQCEIANWQTNACACPQNFIPVQAARILIDVAGGPTGGSTCGSTLFTCVKQ